MFVIYDKPKDHPDAFVCRRWEIGPGTITPKELIIVQDSLESCRSELFGKHPNLTQIPGLELDEHIAEVYG